MTIKNVIAKCKNKYLIFLYILVMLSPSIIRIVEFSKKNQSRNLIAFIISVFILLSPLLLIRLRVKVYALIVLPIYFLSLFELVHFFDYNILIHEGSLWAILDTNGQEAYEYIISSKSALIVIISNLLFLPGLFIFQENCHFVLPKWPRIFLAFILIAILLDFFALTRVSRFSYPYSVLYQIKESRSLKNKMLCLKDNRFSYKAIRKNTHSSSKETYILVVGESMRRENLSIYNYFRNTTPRLSKQESLVVFSDVISPATYTDMFFKIAFYPTNNDGKENYLQKRSFLSALNEVGVSTYWLSNQGRNSVITVITNDCKKTIFTNIDWKVASLDEKVLLPLDTILNDDSNTKKFIVVNIMGSHKTYSHRYPKSFGYFKDVNDSKQSVINEYDNSILYTDYIISEIIKKLEKQNDIALLIYLSDHGQNLGDDSRNIFGHGDGGVTKYTVEVPFFIWYSKKFQLECQDKLDAIIKNKDKAISSRYLSNAIIGLFDIETAYYDNQNDFFSPVYNSETNRKVITSAGQIDYLILNN